LVIILDLLTVINKISQATISERQSDGQSKDTHSSKVL